MRFCRVEFHRFRNLCDAAIDLHPRLNLLSGDNAQGKTNFLEAVFLLAAQRSFRAQRTEELIRWQHSEARVAGEVEVDGITRRLQMDLSHGKRLLTVDGKRQRPGASPLRGISAILFTPDDLSLPRGAPQQRRRLIDRAIATIWPAYLDLQRDYNKVLGSRNRVLRGEGRGRRELLSVYDQQLAAFGAKVVVARQRYLQGIAGGFSESYRRIAQSGVTAALRYDTAPELQLAGPELAPMAEQLGELLARDLQRAVARGQTGVGPHTDDLSFLLDGRPARQFASQGQLRALVLAFRVTQILDTRKRLGHDPILLLDDVSSELDARRNSYLFEFLEEISCQRFVSTTRPELLPIGDDLNKFHIVSGIISG